MVTEDDFFNELAKETDEIYLQSPVFKKNEKMNWWYSICNGPILKNRPVVFGLNWGVAKNHLHSPQRNQPSETDNNKWPFRNQLDHYLSNHFKLDSDKINYSNLCFFRTPKANYLSYQDWRMAIPLFKKYVDFVQPPYAIMLGSPKHLNEEEYSDRERISHISEGRTKRAFIHTGVLFGKYKFVSVPHPQARVVRESRDFLWEETKKYINNKIIIEV